MESKLKLLLNWLSEQNESEIEWLYWFLVDGDDYLLPIIIGKSRWNDIKTSVIEEYKLEKELTTEYKIKKAQIALDEMMKEIKDGKK